MKSFRELRVWQLGMSLVERVYDLTRSFPKEEIFGLSSQLRRAAVSVPSNIAEGHAREHLKEYLHHLSIALGSLGEVETQLELCVRLHYVSRDNGIELFEQTSALGRQVHALRNALRKKATSNQSDT
jgi:four helix bundle protein